MVYQFDDLVYIRGSRIMPWNPVHKMHVYYYLINGLLIDTGPSSLADQAMAFFQTHTIDQVFLTHIHEDHAGMAYWLEENKKVPIYLHPGSVGDALREPELAPYRLDIWGRRRAFTAAPMPDTISTEEYIFDVIDSPGHCPCHKTLFLRDKGWLFSGDLLSVLKPTTVFHEENLSQMIQSIKIIMELPFHTVFCTHTGILSKGRELFTRKLNYLQQIQQRVKALRMKGFSDEDITSQLFPGSKSSDNLLAQDFSSRNIVATL